MYAQVHEGLRRIPKAQQLPSKPQSLGAQGWALWEAS